MTITPAVYGLKFGAHLNGLEPGVNVLLIVEVK
jgi:hypothetical protein